MCTVSKQVSYKNNLTSNGNYVVSFKGALQSLLVNRQRLYLHSVTHQSALWVSMRSNKDFKSVSFLIKHLKILKLFASMFARYSFL